jgi:hypothetical protein
MIAGSITGAMRCRVEIAGAEIVGGVVDIAEMIPELR